MIDIEIGDTVRFQGVVTGFYGLAVGVEDGDDVVYIAKTNLEIVEKRGFRKGDTVSGSDYERLPNGTIVSNFCNEEPGYVKVGGYWYALDVPFSTETWFKSPAGDTERRTILFLPEA